MHHFLYVCLSVCDVTKIHIPGTALHKVPKFGQSMDMDDLEVDLEGQGHRSKVKVTRLKNMSLGKKSLVKTLYLWNCLR